MIVQNLAARLGLAVKRQGEVFRSAIPADRTGGGLLDPDTWPPSATLRADGAQPRVPDTGRGAPTMKAWHCCLGANAPLTAFFSIVAEAGLEPDDIEAVTVTVRQDPWETATFRDPPCTPLRRSSHCPAS